MKSKKSVVLVSLWLALAQFGVASETDSGELPSSNFAAGQSSYTENCAACHGVSGAGDGVVAAVLKNGVPDLTGLCSANGGVFPAERVYRVIDGRIEFTAHGTRLMPIWGMEFWLDEGADERADIRVAEKIHQLIAYLKSLAENCKP